jgi:putative flippase GtrA
MGKSQLPHMHHNPWSQLLRYTLVGIASNVSGYLVYLLATYYGATPKITMSILYAAGAVVSFWGNRRVTFSFQGSLLGSGLRYVIAHFFGYLLNLCILIVFVDKLRFAHQIVQAVAIFVVALFLFTVFKVFVFTELATPQKEGQ